ncbi:MULTISPECIES: glycosyl hydrolase 108 family protein [Acetobacter]|nr:MULTISPECIES: glycosyl hydrolase 108 family protein [Acetobacter]ATI11053.1 hypothetical protein CPF11_00425 [Acetobacter pomorum]AXC26607.1 hypothetical protein DS739_07240 [Acetobacter sp. JWB]KAA8386034.1 hypothetical protein FKW31_07660 [Acetobacter sp. DmW_136]KAA8420358.1 hypothetical protein FKW54_14070 [Acetobacter pomorum]KAA8431407.1 hypothetical protein FKW50_13280 [Acetobacter pomorum]
MQTNLSQSLNFTLDQEGAYQCNRADTGNWSGGRVGVGVLAGTKYGISAALMACVLGSRSAVTRSMMQQITVDQYREVATERFWDVLRCDDLPAGVDLMLFDHGFNAGTPAAAQELQRIVGVPVPDGEIGPQTLSCLSAVTAQEMCASLSVKYTQQLQSYLGVAPDGMPGPKTLSAVVSQNAEMAMLLYALASVQEAYYRSLKSFSQFGAAWIKRLDARLFAAHRLLNIAPEIKRTSLSV